MTVNHRIRAGVCGLLLAAVVFTLSARAATDKYRLVWRDDPATTMVIGWNQKSGSDARVCYGSEDHGTEMKAYPNTQRPDVIRDYRGMKNCFARLTGLNPDQAYYFVIADSDGPSARLWFKTAPAAPKPFTFVAGGDTRTNQTPRVNGNKLIAKLRPLFIWFGGDYTGSGKDAEWAEWLDDWQHIISADGRMYPIIAGYGNHENADPKMIFNLFDTSNEDMYWAQNVGGAMLRLYTLNTELDQDPVKWAAQTAWLKHALEAQPNFKWKMADYHQPMRPHRADKPEGDLQYASWATLFHQVGINLVVECDTHLVKSTYPIRPDNGPDAYQGFIRDDATGTVYIGEGGWGAPMRPTDDLKPWTMACDSFWHYQWIHLYPEHAEIRVLKLENVEQVKANTEEDVFKVPDGLDVWSPPCGPVLYLPYKEGVAKGINK